MNSTEQPSTDFFALETALHKKTVRNSPDAVAALLADDFMEFGRSGTIYTKATIIEFLKGETWIRKSPSRISKAANLVQVWR
jgi:hypothetical protein